MTQTFDRRPSMLPEGASSLQWTLRRTAAFCLLLASVWRHNYGLTTSYLRWIRPYNGLSVLA